MGFHLSLFVVDGPNYPSLGKNGSVNLPTRAGAWSNPTLKLNPYWLGLKKVKEGVLPLTDHEHFQQPVQGKPIELHTKRSILGSPVHSGIYVRSSGSLNYAESNRKDLPCESSPFMYSLSFHVLEDSPQPGAFSQLQMSLILAFLG